MRPMPRTRTPRRRWPGAHGARPPAERRIETGAARDVHAQPRRRPTVPRRSKGVRRRRLGARRRALHEVRKTDPANPEAERLLAKAERQMQPSGAEDRARVRDLYLRCMVSSPPISSRRAITEWSKILEIDPGNSSVYENIREARARLRALQP